MIYRTFHNNQPLTIVPFVLIGLLLSIVPLVFLPQITVPIKAMPLAKGLLELLPVHPYFLTISGCLIIIFSSLYFNLFLNQQNIFKSTYIPGLIAMLGLFSTPAFCNLSPLTLSLPFLLIGIKQVFHLAKEECTDNQFFQSGLYFAVASLFYFPTIYFYPFVLIGFIFFRSNFFRELLISISGLLIPYIFLGTYLFWQNTHQIYFEFITQNYLDYHISFDPKSILLWTIDLGIILGMTKGTARDEMTVKNRRNKQMFLFLFITGIHAQYLSHIPIELYPVFIIFPFAGFSASYLSHRNKKWLQESSLYFYLSLILYYQFITI